MSNIVTPSAIPAYLIALRAHKIKDSIIATYAIGRGRTYTTGYSYTPLAQGKNIECCKLEILNAALEALGEGKKVTICTEDKFLQDFLESGHLKNEKKYQAVVDELLNHLSLCASVGYKKWADSMMFNAALQEYRSMKALYYPETISSDLPPVNWGSSKARRSNVV